MKTILVPTDFSETAANAARYALFLSRQLQADVLVVHAFKVPAEARGAAQLPWAPEDYEQIRQDCRQELDLLCHQLEEAAAGDIPTGVYVSKVSGTAELGDVTTTVRNLVGHHRSALVVMGMSGASVLQRFFLGSSSRELIDKATFPVLLVPAKPVRHKLRKIAFATDLSPGDIYNIQYLVTLARPFNAKIMIAHVTDTKHDIAINQPLVDHILSEVAENANYHHIYYRHIDSPDVDHGLDWLSHYGMIDMLAMVHRAHPILQRLVKGSHTQRLAKHIHIPLLVFPPDAHTGAFNMAAGDQR